MNVGPFAAGIASGYVSMDDQYARTQARDAAKKKKQQQYPNALRTMGIEEDTGTSYADGGLVTYNRDMGKKRR